MAPGVQIQIIMTLRQLGNSDLNITRIGIGAWAIGGGKWEFGWGPQNDDDSIEAIHAGLDRGLNWIDTAAVYGLGHSETIVGMTIKERREGPAAFPKLDFFCGPAGNLFPTPPAPPLHPRPEDSP